MNNRAKDRIPSIATLDSTPKWMAIVRSAANSAVQRIIIVIIKWADRALKEGACG